MSSPSSAALADVISVRAPDEQPVIRTIVVATDGTNESDPAIRLAHTYAEHAGASLSAVSVCEAQPANVGGSPFMPLYLPEDSEMSRINRTAVAKAQLLKILGANVKCPLSVRAGVMGTEVAEYANEAHADLIIAGRGRHRTLDRLRGEEHLVRLTRRANCPVLAAEPSLQSPPRRIVVGIDFSADNLVAVRTAIALGDDDAAVYLVHVKPDPPFGIPHPGQWLKSYDDGVRAGLEQLRTQLALPAARVVEPIVVNGHPGVAVSDFAKRTNADLIAVGAHGAGFFSRLVIGTVTSHLLRSATCSVLAIPGSREKLDKRF